jgi:hypothetical protein
MATVVGTLGCLALLHNNNGGCFKITESKLIAGLVYLGYQQGRKLNKVQSNK